MNFGVKLKELRTNKQLTQLQMAQILETSKSNISKYEAGSIEPSLETLRKISHFFNVSIDYLLEISSSNITLDTVEPFYKTLSEREIDIITVYRQLNKDNQDIIVGELKKCLKEQRHEESTTIEKINPQQKISS